MFFFYSSSFNWGGWRNIRKDWEWINRFQFITLNYVTIWEKQEKQNVFLLIFINWVTRHRALFECHRSSFFIANPEIHSQSFASKKKKRKEKKNEKKKMFGWPIIHVMITEENNNKNFRIKKDETDRIMGYCQSRALKNSNNNKKTPLNTPKMSKQFYCSMSCEHPSIDLMLSFFTFCRHPYILRCGVLYINSGCLLLLLFLLLLCV